MKQLYFFIFIFFIFTQSMAFAQDSIQVINALWGTKDVSSLASTFCNSKTTCDYKVSPKFVGVHSGPVKSFTITWKCGLSQKPNTLSLPADATDKIVSLKCESQPVTKAGPSHCNPMFAETPSECAAASAWTPDQLSDPESLDSGDNFKIVFHSITAFGWVGRGAPDAGSWNEKLLHDPNLISNNPKISASLISETKNKTFIGYLGIILEVHPENMVVASPSDAGSPRITGYSTSDTMQLKNYSRRFSIITPTELLNRTSEYIYNEIVLTGKPTMGQEVKAAGFLLSCRTTKMTKLNLLTDSEFKTFIKTKCHSFSDSVIEALKQHRGTYPIYGYPIKP